MKNLLLLLCIAMQTNLSSQKIGFINSDIVLSNSSEGKAALMQLENERQMMENQMNSNKEKYYTEKSKLDMNKDLIKAELYQSMYNDLSTLKKTIDAQEEYFGSNGQFAIKRKEVLKPFINNMTMAIMNLAQKKSLDAVYEIGTNRLLYINPDADYTRELMTEIQKGTPNSK